MATLILLLSDLRALSLSENPSLDRPCSLILHLLSFEYRQHAIFLKLCGQKRKEIPRFSEKKNGQ